MIMKTLSDEGAPGAYERFSLPGRHTRLLQLGDKCFGNAFGTGGVLASDQLAIFDDKGSPVRPFFIKSAQALEFIFDQKGHDIGQLYCSFLAIGESGDSAPFNQRCAVSGLDMTQDPGRVTDKTNGLARSLEGLDKLDGRLRLGQIPQRSMTARVEHGVKVFTVDGIQLDGIRQSPPGIRIRVETVGHVRLEIRQLTLWVQGWLTTGWRRQNHLGPRILEDVVRRCELFKPESCSCLSPHCCGLAFGNVICLGFMLVALS